MEMFVWYRRWYVYLIDENKEEKEEKDKEEEQAEQTSSHDLNQWWFSLLMYIYVSRPQGVSLRNT